MGLKDTVRSLGLGKQPCPAPRGISLSVASLEHQKQEGRLRVKPSHTQSVTHKPQTESLGTKSKSVPIFTYQSGGNELQVQEQKLID